MSFGVRHSMLLVAEIHVASLGADQLSFGTTFPPSSAMIDFTFRWISSQASDGSICSSSSESYAVDDEADEKIPLSVSVREGSSLSSEGRTMPSERRYSTKGLERGIRRAFGVIERYLWC